MKPYEWMIKHTPQKTWIEGKGIFSLLAFYAGPLGAGLYLLSLYFNSLTGIVISLLIIALLKGGAHLLELKHPLKFWRMAFRLRSSWISRGVILMVLFMGLVFVQIFLSMFLPGTHFEFIVKVLAVITAIGLSIYSGLVLTYMKGISLWNSSIVPILLSLSGILGGFAIMLIISMFDVNISTLKVELGSGMVILIILIFMAVYLLSVTYTGPAGKYAATQIIKGQIAPITHTNLRMSIIYF